MAADAGWRAVGRRLVPAVVGGGLVALVVAASAAPRPAVQRGAAGSDAALVGAIDRAVAARWQAAGVEPATPADELTVLRRAWLALAGTIPSLEEIRRFEADAAPNRLDRWITGLLAERRSAEYLAGRWVRVLTGSENGPFLVFRRDRFTAWLADAIHANRPLDEIVTALVSARGLWTDTPAVNFVTQAQANGALDADVLAARVARCFLGQRIDCAQCHDHPFAPVTQPQFEGLAAHFAQARITGLGLEDDPRRVHRIDVPPPEPDVDGGMAAGMAMVPQVRNVPPRVPFGAAWVPPQGTHRQRLAGWLVHPDNRRFDRALANRVWLFVFGRPWHEPVDDLPDPAAEVAVDDPVDVVAAALRDHGRDLRRVLLALTATRLFRLESRHPLRDDPDTCSLVDAAWGAFPLTPLHPEQLIAGLSQATSLHTIDTEAHLLPRTVRFFRTLDFVRDYGRPEERGDGAVVATVPQSLLRMNGRLTRELTEANAFTAAGRIAGMAPDEDTAVELVYLLALTRRPDAEERSTMRSVIDLATTRGRGLEDVCWALVNAAEFAWNH
jgi:hypothetical protein